MRLLRPSVILRQNYQSPIFETQPGTRSSSFLNVNCFFLWQLLFCKISEIWKGILRFSNFSFKVCKFNSENRTLRSSPSWFHTFLLSIVTALLPPPVILQDRINSSFPEFRMVQFQGQFYENGLMRDSLEFWRSAFSEIRYLLPRFEDSPKNILIIVDRDEFIQSRIINAIFAREPEVLRVL